MAGRGWTAQVGTAAGVAAGTGAAQLGLGYGLGVVVWPVGATADDSVWLGSLGWATWIAASSTVFGAVVAGRLRGGQGGLWRLALAVSAALGALLTVALIALPARPAERADTPTPEAVAAGYAVAGVVIGLVVAYWAVFSRPVAANLFATAGYLWTLAAAAIVVELITGRDSATYLNSWQFAELDGPRYGTIFWPSSLITLLAALLIGMLAVWPAVRRGHFGVAAATSGAVGPLLVAAAFLVLAPRLTGALGQLQSAYLIAPYAVLAGLAGSAFAVALGQRAAERRRQQHHRPAPPAATGVATVPAQGGPVAAEEVPGSATTASTDAVPGPAEAEAGPATARAKAEATPATAATGPADAQAGSRAVVSGPAGAGSAGPAGRTTSSRRAPAAETAGARRKRPTSGATAAPTPDTRSTVTAPPTRPPVARINPPREAGPG
jgi:MFS family permease